jgi:periplasmic protein TonB
LGFEHGPLWGIWLKQKRISNVPEGINKKKNRVLGITLVLSILVHGLILMNMTDIFHENDFIELSLKEESKPSVRNIPSPPEIKKQDSQAKKNAPLIKKNPENPPEPIPKPVPEPLPKTDDLIPVPRKNISPPSSLPEIPAVQPPAVQTSTVQPSNVKTIRAFGSTQDYLQMVRMKIESHKKYPYAALRQNITGSVTVKFIIETDGRVSGLNIVQKSKFELLNKAALEAIKSCDPFPVPPPAYFKKPLPIQISILFDLN